MIFTFSDTVLDTQRHVLTQNGNVVPVEPQVFDVIRVLAEAAGDMVTKDQLIEAVWGGRIVSEATIAARISAARTALGDNGADQKVIRTIARRGFQMVPEVRVELQRAETAPEDLRQIIRYTTSRDGSSIAWSSAGKGSPVLCSWHHLSHLEQDWASDLIGPGFRRLAEGHRLIRFDIRGAGLSESIRPGDTLDEHVADMQAVADAAGLDRFAIVATLQSAAVAIRFAARNPERVSRLVLHNGYARGRALRPNAPKVSENDPFIALLKSGGWGDPENGFMRAWLTMVLPMASFDETTEIIRLIAHAGSTEEALVQRELIDTLDVLGDLSLVRAPTRVIHSRMCAIHPAAEGRRVAAGIPGAEFMEVDSSNTFFIASDPMFDRVMTSTLEFLDEDPAA